MIRAARRDSVPLFLRSTLAAALVALAPVPCAAHVAGDGALPQVELTVRIDELAVISEIHLPLDLFVGRVLAKRTLSEFRAVDPGDRIARAAEFFHERCPLAIDGIAVRPLVEELELQIPNIAADGSAAELEPLRLGALRLRATYPAKGRPARVAVVWRLFAPAPLDTPRFDREVIVAEIDAFGHKTLAELSKDEPEHVWHAAGAGAEDDGPAPEDIPAPASSESSARWVSRSVALAALALAVALLPLALRRRGGALGAAVALLALTGGAALPFAFGTLTLGSASTLDPHDALRIFESLHRNVYRAFDYSNESDVYDTLAASVDGPQLDAIYERVYRGLILRDEGGAVCKIRSVDIVDARLVDVGARGAWAAGDRAAFRVDCRWTVDGVVRHWGHAHERTKEFHAVYTIAPRERAWKIVDSALLSSEGASRASGAARAVVPPPRAEVRE